VMGWSPIQGVLQAAYQIKKLKKDQGPTERLVEP
jgi:hypothetical protein